MCFVFCLPSSIVCNQPLGLEDGTIKNSQLTTPPGSTTGGKEGFYARLNNDEAWCIPQLKSSEDVFRDKVYLEIDLGEEKSIRALALQGIFCLFSFGFHPALQLFRL